MFTILYLKVKTIKSLNGNKKIHRNKTYEGAIQPGGYSAVGCPAERDVVELCRLIPKIGLPSLKEAGIIWLNR